MILPEKPRPEDLRFALSLHLAALRVRERAYAPYSKYKVGAAIMTQNHRTYVGCNVETANYDCTHAEEAALAAMVADGHRAPRWLLVVSGLEENERPISAAPCGKCRQKLMEFSQLSGHDLGVFVVDGTGNVDIIRLSYLLPDAFGPAATRA